MHTTYIHSAFAYIFMLYVNHNQPKVLRKPSNRKVRASGYSKTPTNQDHIRLTPFQQQQKIND